MTKAKRTREKKVFPVYSYGHLARLHLRRIKIGPWSVIRVIFFRKHFLIKSCKSSIFSNVIVLRGKLFSSVCVHVFTCLTPILPVFVSILRLRFFFVFVFFVFVFLFSSNKSNLIALQWCTYWAVLRSYPIEEKQPQKKRWIVSIESIAFIALKTTTCRIIYIIFSNFLHE